MIKTPNYTQIPNVYFDEIMQTLSGSENLVFLAIMRKTFGWQKKKDRISYSQIMEMTGLAKSTTSYALKALDKMNLITTEIHGQYLAYHVNITDETVPKIEPVGKSNCTENRTGTVPKIVPVIAETVPKIVHTKESNINKLSKEMYTHIENEYTDTFKTLFPDGKILLDFARNRKRIKVLLDKLTEGDIVNAIHKAKEDQWIVSSGFALSTILGDFQINKLLNGSELKKSGFYPKAEAGYKFDPKDYNDI